MSEEINMAIVKEFWHLFDERNYSATEKLLHEDFEAYWVCTKERFDREYFIQMNEEYPGRWRTVIERLYPSGEQVITFVHIFSPDSEEQFYVSSIFTVEDGKIIQLEEYYANVDNPPEWRQ